MEDQVQIYLLVFEICFEIRYKMIIEAEILIFRKSLGLSEDSVHIDQLPLCLDILRDYDCGAAETSTLFVEFMWM